VSKSSHEEAIGVFQSASEPILVQMLRRAPVKPSPSELSSVKVRLLRITIIYLVHHV
jgi:hypothetical protein